MKGLCLFATAICVAAMGLAGEASAKSAKVFVDNGWVVDGDAKYELTSTYSNICNSNKLEFGTNEGIIQVDKFKDMDHVHGYLPWHMNWTCGNGGISHTKCSLGSEMWVSRKLGPQFFLFCLGDSVGTGH